MTVASSWRMSLGRREFLTAAAQLQKCVDWLRAHNQDIPGLPNEEFIKLLRDISEHWGQIADRKSRGRVKELRSDERPGSVRYGLHRIAVGGGLISHDVVQWAQKRPMGTEGRQRRSRASLGCGPEAPQAGRVDRTHLLRRAA